MTTSEAILSGVAAATEVHDRLGTQAVIEVGSRGNIDVFGSIINEGATLIFRPLDGLLGACIAGPGVMISTTRPLQVQRFTGAHELGHVELHHTCSFDTEEMITPGIMSGGPDIETQANSFAGEFLLPPWLFEHHARKQQWDAQSMADPKCVYQMSLRAGASYAATIYALERHKIINATISHKLLAIQPKTIKEDLLPGYQPENWYRDVWLLTNKDEGTFVEGQPGDLFRFDLNEKSGAGYIWDFQALKESGFVILSDERDQKGKQDGIGADVFRKLTAQSKRVKRGELKVQLKRPWENPSTAIETLHLKYDLFGKENGLPRAQRPQLSTAA